MAVPNCSTPPAVDEDISEEERLLITEAEELREKLDAARKSVQDTDFYKLTEKVPELGRLKFKIRRHLRGHLAKVTDLHWSEDSQHLITASQDGKLIVWDTYSDNKIHMIPLKTAWVIGCGFSPSSNFICSGGLDNLVSVFNLKSDDIPIKPGRELAGHEGYIACCRFLDDNRILTCSGDKSCALWDVEKSCITSSYLGHTNDVNAIALREPNKQNFVSVSTDKSCRMWDTREATCTQIFEGHELDVNGVAFFPNNDYAFVTSSDDGSCRLWDVRADQPVAVYIDDYIQCGSTSVAVSKSGRLMVAGYDDYNCHVWDLLREERVGIMPAHDGRISCVGITKDGVAIATGSWDTTCLIWTAK